MNEKEAAHPHEPDAATREPDATFDLDGHSFACFLPLSDADPLEWTITVTKDGVVVRTDKVAMTYPPIFGVDVGDLATRDAHVEIMIRELGLQG